MQALLMQLLIILLAHAGQQQGDGGYTIQTDLPLNQQMNGFDYVAGETYTSEWSMSISNVALSGNIVYIISL